MDSESQLAVGIFFNARREQGGLYQYALTLVDCLRQFGHPYKYTLFLATLEPFPIKDFPKNWTVCSLPAGQIKLRMAIELGLMTLGRKGLIRPLYVLPQFSEIKNARLDGMIYVKPTIHSFLWPYPAIFPIHDLQHRLQPQFPEVSANGEANRREMMYQNATTRARAIITDSETGREDVVECYSVHPNLVHSLPYLSPTYYTYPISDDTTNQTGEASTLPEKYLFYPAAFWLHKNHKNLILALSLLRQEFGVTLPLLLAGSPRHQYPQIKKLVDECGLTDQVVFLGYVPDIELPRLYRQAFCLVMPTFFGPTNLPILEAWQYDCPVITSDIRGIREQVGDAGILVDPNQPLEIAKGILSLIQNPDLHDRLIQNGKSRVKDWTPEKFARKLSRIIQDSFS